MLHSVFVLHKDAFRIVYRILQIALFILRYFCAYSYQVLASCTNICKIVGPVNCCLVNAVQGSATQVLISDRNKEFGNASPATITTITTAGLKAISLVSGAFILHVSSYLYR